MRKVFRAIIYYKNHGGRQGLELVPLYKEDSAKFPQWVLYFGLRQRSVARVDYRRTESGAGIAGRDSDPGISFGSGFQKSLDSDPDLV